MGKGSGASGARGGASSSTAFARPENKELTSALVNNKQAPVVTYLKESPVGTEVFVRVNGINSVYTKETATQWRRDNGRIMTNRDVATNIMRANSQYSTVSDLYDKAFKVRYRDGR